MNPTAHPGLALAPDDDLDAWESVRVFVDPAQGLDADRAHRLEVALDAGQVNLDNMSRDGFTLLELALANKEANIDVLKVLVAHDAPTASQVSDTARLMLTSEDANAIVQAWSQEIADPKRHGTEAVAWADRQNRPELIRRVMTNKVTKEDLDRWLVGAVHGGRSVVADALLTLGANPNQIVDQERQETLLHKGADHKALTLTLLKHGATVDPINAAGLTPLHVAIRADNPISVMQLLKHGADLNYKNPQGLDA